MGQTDIQFKAFIRFLLSALEDAEKEVDERKRIEKRRRIMDSLRDILVES